MADRWGITETGFITPTFTEILDVIEELLRDPAMFGEQLDFTEPSPVRWIASVWAEMLSNKGLQASDLYTLWPSLREAFFNTFRDYAEDVSLDMVGQYRDLKRAAAIAAEGILCFEGEPDTVVPSGTLAARASDETLQVATTRAITIGAGGTAYVPAQATVTGIAHNAAAFSYTTLPENVAFVDAVNNPRVSATHNIGGETVHEYAQIPNDSGTGYYQLVDVSLLDIPVAVTSIEVPVRNPTASAQTYHLQWHFYDDATGTLVDKSAVFLLQLAGSEVATFLADNLYVDLAEYASIRATLINHENSEGDLDVGLAAVETGAFYANGVLEAERDMISDWTMYTDGEFTGGREVESDFDYRERQKRVLFNAAGGTPNGIYSALSMLPNVLGVKVYVNNSAANLLVAPGLTLGPFSYRAVLDGGDPDDIAAILASSGAGLFGTGDVTREVELTNGEVERISFSYATKKPVYVQVTLRRGSAYPRGTGDADVKDAIIQAIGGVDSEGTIHRGGGIGKDASHAHIVSTIMTNVPGIDSMDVRLGSSFSTVVEDLYQILALERGWATTDTIRVI